VSFTRSSTASALKAIADLGFALGGGQALHVHGYGGRLSLDLDFYVTKFDQAPFDRAEAATSPDGQPNYEHKTSTAMTPSLRTVVPLTGPPEGRSDTC
jgi:hypothetical protein